MPRITPRQRAALEVLEWTGGASAATVSGDSDLFRSEADAARTLRSLSERGLVTYHSFAYSVITNKGRDALKQPEN